MWDMFKIVSAPCARCGKLMTALIKEPHIGKLVIKCNPCGYTFYYDYPRP